MSGCHVPSSGGNDHGIEGFPNGTKPADGLCGRIPGPKPLYLFLQPGPNDGYIQIASIFEETANQEKEHAKRFFKFLQGGEVKIECAFPAGIVGTTADNLLAAASGEHEEWSVLYPGFAAIARQEGFPAIAIAFEKISVAEKQHERRYRGLLENIQNGRVFKRRRNRKWRCLNCGYVHEGPDAPGLVRPAPSPGILRAACGELVRLSRT